MSKKSFADNPFSRSALKNKNQTETKLSVENREKNYRIAEANRRAAEAALAKAERVAEAEEKKKKCKEFIDEVTEYYENIIKKYKLELEKKSETPLKIKIKRKKRPPKIRIRTRKSPERKSRRTRRQMRRPPRTPPKTPSKTPPRTRKKKLKKKSPIRLTSETAELPNSIYSPKSKTPSGLSPLLAAIDKGDVESERRILNKYRSKGNYIEQINSEHDGRNPLIEAVRKGYSDKYVNIVKLLLRAGGDVNIEEEGSFGVNALKISNDMVKQTVEDFEGGIKTATKNAVEEINNLLHEANQANGVSESKE
jgi:hypothetical protein